MTLPELSGILRRAIGSDDPAVAAMAAGELGDLLNRQGMEDDVLVGAGGPLQLTCQAPWLPTNLGAVCEARGRVEEA